MYDLLILNVKHSKFEKVNFKKVKSNMTIVDTNNVLSKKNIDIINNKYFIFYSLLGLFYTNFNKF